MENATSNETLSLVYKANGRCRAVVLMFHGGCFTGGKPTWDVSQNLMLASLGFEVHQLAFPKTWTAWLKWARSFVEWPLSSSSSLNAGPVVCAGRSSGGYLACAFAAMHADRVSKLLLFCPVLDPEKRTALLPKFEAKTRAFFGERSAKPVDLSLNRRSTTMLVLAKNDGNVPLHLYPQELVAGAFFPGPSTHTGVLRCTSKTLQQALTKWMAGRDK